MSDPAQIAAEDGGWRGFSLFGMSYLDDVIYSFLPVKADLNKWRAGTLLEQVTLSDDSLIILVWLGDGVYLGNWTSYSLLWAIR